MDPDLKALLAKNAAGYSGAQQTGPQPIVPLWKVAPKNRFSERVNYGQIGDDLRVADTEGESRGGRITGGRYTNPLNREVLTPDAAATKFLEMDQGEREEFKILALQSGLLKLGQDGFVSQDEIFNAWEKATRYAATWNGERDKSQWLSPWEAARRLALENKAGEGGEYDAFGRRKPTTTTNRSTRTVDFTSGEALGNITGTMREIFKAEMGREPTEAEIKAYSGMVQKAYDANPETTTSKSTTDAAGNTTVQQNVTGGIDVGETLLTQVRDDDETDAFQAGSTFFSAAMQALGAIA